MTSGGKRYPANGVPVVAVKRHRQSPQRKRCPPRRSKPSFRVVGESQVGHVCSFPLIFLPPHPPAVHDEISTPPHNSREPSRMPQAVATAWGTRAGSASGASSTSHTPSG